MPDLDGFHAFTGENPDDMSADALMEAVAAYFNACQIAELKAKHAAPRPTLIGGQVPVGQYEASRPMTGSEARIA